MPSIAPPSTTTTISTTAEYGEPSIVPQSPTESEVGETSPHSLVDRYFSTMLSHVGTSESLSSLFSYTAANPIGRGSVSTVYRGHSLSDLSHSVAIKHTPLPSKSDAVDWFAKYLALRDCHFYTRYDAFYLPSSHTGIIVMDVLSDSLTDVDADLRIGMDADTVRSMVRDVTRQLATLRAQTSSCHLDVKPANIMRRADGRFTLIDFDFATRIGDEVFGYLGTREWSAPEMRPEIGALNVVSASQDMWSLALCVLYALCGGRQPMMARPRRVKRTESLSAISKWYVRRVSGRQSAVEQWLSVHLVSGALSGDAFDFVFQCLRYDAEKRMTPQKALLHKWLR